MALLKSLHAIAKKVLVLTSIVMTNLLIEAKSQDVSQSNKLSHLEVSVNLEKGSKETCKAGRLEVITGPMYSGKSEELIKRLMELNIARKQYIAFVSEPMFNVKGLTITSRARTQEVKGLLLKESDYDKLVVWCQGYDVVAFDEVQFHSEKLVDAIKLLMSQGKRIIVAGLNQDYRGEVFEGCIASLMAMANHIKLLTAICSVCYKESATMTQRYINGKRVEKEGKLVVVEGVDECITYGASCFTDHLYAQERSKKKLKAILAKLGFGQNASACLKNHEIDEQPSIKLTEKNAKIAV